MVEKNCVTCTGPYQNRGTRRLSTASSRRTPMRSAACCPRGRSALGFLGEFRVNVLAVNLALGSTLIGQNFNEARYGVHYA